MNEIYTVGIWMIKPGKENEFVSKWSSFADWTKKNISDVGTGRLLQDTKDPLKFISFGDWQSEVVIQNWRNSDAFKNFVDSVKDICQDFQPNSLKLVASF